VIRVMKINSSKICENLKGLYYGFGKVGQELLGFVRPCTDDC
jgi:hypothetical protein